MLDWEDLWYRVLVEKTAGRASKVLKSHFSTCSDDDIFVLYPLSFCCLQSVPFSILCMWTHDSLLLFFSMCVCVCVCMLSFCMCRFMYLCQTVAPSTFWSQINKTLLLQLSQHLCVLQLLWWENFVCVCFHTQMLISNRWSPNLCVYLVRMER